MHNLDIRDRPSINADQEQTANEPHIDDPALSMENHADSGRLYQFTTPHTMKKPSFPILLITVVTTVVLGIGTGYVLNQVAPAGALSDGSTAPVSQVATGAVKAGDVFGSSDVDSFKDTASGYLMLGGLEGEGSHRMLRAGGESQTVYLTSSITDLSKFEGMEVKIWGETFRGQKAGWLMDVGRIEVMNPQAQAPE